MWVLGRKSQRAATLESTTNNIAYDGQISEEEKKIKFFHWITEHLPERSH